MIKTIYSLIGLALVQQLALSPAQAGQSTSPPQLGEHRSTQEQRDAMGRWNAESGRVFKVVQPLLKKARELWDSGNPVAASRYYEKASMNQRAFYDVPADLILEESLVAQGRYREAAGIGQLYGPTIGPPVWLVLSDCEIGQFEAAERLFVANTPAFAPLLRGFAFGLTQGAERSPDTLKAMAWLLLESREGPSHTFQARYNWLKKAHLFSKHNALIELRMAQLLNGPLKQPAHALTLLEDARHQIGSTHLAADDPLNEIGPQYDVSVGLTRSATNAKTTSKD